MPGHILQFFPNFVCWLTLLKIPNTSASLEFLFRFYHYLNIGLLAILSAQSKWSSFGAASPPPPFTYCLSSFTISPSFRNTVLVVVKGGRVGKYSSTAANFLKLYLLTSLGHSIPDKRP